MKSTGSENRGFTGCMTSGLLTAAGAESVYDTTVSLQWATDGILKAVVTAITDGTTPTTDFNTGLAFPPLVGGASVANTPGHGCIVVWALKISDASVVCLMGPHANLDMQGNFQWDGPQFPAIPGTVVPFAYQVLKAGATASATAIVFGTANWNATGFTNVIDNVCQLPSRPKVA